MKILASAYNSFLLSMALTVTLFGSQWLEMRVNMGLILAASWAVFFTAALLVCFGKKLRMPLWFTFACTVVCNVYTLLVLGPRRLGIVPAAIVREGIGMPRLPFSTVNFIMIVTLSLMLAVLAVGEIYQLRHRRDKQ